MFDIWNKNSAHGAPGAICRTALSGLRGWLAQIRTEVQANHRLMIGDMAAVVLAHVCALLMMGFGPLPGVENSTAPLPEISSWLSSSLAALCLCAIIYPVVGFYRRHTKSTSLRDVTILSRGAFLAIAAQALIVLLAHGAAVVPLAQYLVQFLLTVPALGALRIIARRRELIRKSQRRKLSSSQSIPVLLIGTGTNCDLFLRSLRNTNSRYQPVGIIDDGRDALGLYFHFVKIVGSLRDPEAAIAAVMEAQTLPKQLLLTDPITHFDRDGIQRLMRWAKGHGISVARLPGLSEPEITSPAGLQGPAGELRSVDPEEILNRPQKEVEKSLLRALFQGRRVLITGAGGSIGSELTRQVAAFDPASLVLIDNCELNAYTIDQDLGQYFPNVPRHVHVASVRDAGRIRSIFRAHRPELVFNAAALKHVPMVELNPCEGVLTNVIGTRNIADCTREVGAAAMVQISTDKAVNTTNVMGATKRVAEFYVQAQDRITSETLEQTRFFSVRFGNVLGSSGSLIPLFQRQLREGGPLTVTDPRMERFFMTIREAVELTLVAAARGLDQNTGLGQIFVLDMGNPVRIVDLAERMIQLSGLTPYDDIDIEFIGIRPGEKLFEELFDRAETRHDSGIDGVQSAHPDGIPIAHLRAAILRLEEAARRGDEPAVRALLQELVPGYGAAANEPPRSSTARQANALPSSQARRTHPKSARRRPVAGPRAIAARAARRSSADDVTMRQKKGGSLWIGE